MSPICGKCGSYYSEISCPFCTPDDSPDSPVKTIEVTEKKTVRMIDPIELLEALDEIKAKIQTLTEESDAKIKNLTAEITKREEVKNGTKNELSLSEFRINELKTAIHGNQEEKQGSTVEKHKVEQEIKILNEKINALEQIVTEKEQELSNLKNEVGVV